MDDDGDFLNAGKIVLDAPLTFWFYPSTKIQNPPHKFRVGDYVKCIDKPSSHYRIEVGKIYKVLSLGSWNGEIEVNADGGVSQWIFASRFEKVDEPVKNDGPIKVGNWVECIETQGALNLSFGKTYEVRKIYGSYLFIRNNKKDVGFYHSRRFKKIDKQENSSQTNSMNKKITYYVRRLIDGSFDKSGQSVHADILSATKLYERLTEKHVKDIYAIFVEVDGVEPLIAQSREELKAPVINGHEMKYEKGIPFVKFGCAEISIALIRDLLNIMNSNYGGNRKVVKMTLCSGVEITKGQAEEILKYVGKVNETKWLHRHFKLDFPPWAVHPS